MEGAVHGIGRTAPNPGLDGVKLASHAVIFRGLVLHPTSSLKNDCVGG